MATSNVYRTASGTPGPMYWKQQADYEMNITLDDENQKNYGTETATYFNNSPNNLNYLWIQLDQNIRARNSDSKKIRTMRISGDY